MTAYRGSRFFELPHAAVYLVLTATIVVSGLCFMQSGTPTAPPNLLYRYGAMYTWALDRHEYWRLIAYGFLHVDFVHLTTNMLCLVIWGAHLEKRVGALYFLIIYFTAMVFGALIGHFMHSTYITVGASGATSGLLGALLALWILGKISLDASFFAVNIALNVAFALSYSRINWQVHLGGFAAGLIACGMLDAIEKLNALVLRCKFPEFVKTNIFGLIVASVILLWSRWLPAAVGSAALLPAIACAAIGFLVVKAVDIVLSQNKGLAIIVVALATANAAVVLLGGIVFATSLSSVCARPGGPFPIETLLGAACFSPLLTSAIVSVCAFAVTMFLYNQEFRRGIADVGFIGSSLRGERKRRQGL